MGILREALKTCYLHRRSIIVIKRHIRFQTCLHKQQPIIRIYKGIIHEKTLHWLDENLEEFLLVVMLAAMTLIMGIQIFSRYALGQSLSWSEEVTRFLFIWSGFLSVSYCSKKCLSIKIEQFVAAFPRRGKALFKVVNHTFELIFSFI